MRDLVLNKKRKKRVNSRSTSSRERQHLRQLPPNVHVVETLADYKKVICNEKERIAVARFYAPWCKACKAVAPLYYHMATKYPDTLFVDVPVTGQNAKLHQGLGVPSLPYGHIYHPQAGLVEELKLTRKHVADFDRRLESYITGQCDLSTAPTPPPQPEAAVIAEEKSPPPN